MANGTRSDRLRRVVLAPDKYRGTARAADVAAAMAAAARDAGWDADQAAMSDGGEGLLDCFGGANQTTTVAGPLGTPVAAGWRLDGPRAVIESALASGLALTGRHNDPVAATTTGTGELIAAAIDAGAQHIVVGVGGSATTDGGAGAVAALARYAPFDGTSGVRITVAADVTATFADAARLFAPQKGADAHQVETLTQRLRDVAARYQERYGVDVTQLPGSGAAGGLGGGLAALGARIVPGFDVVAAEVRLAERIAGADLVATGEGLLDATSLLGKTPVAVARLAARHGVPCLIVAGDVAPGLDLSAISAAGVEVVSLAERFGLEEAKTLSLRCARMAVRVVLG